MATRANEHKSGMSTAQFRCAWRVPKDVTLRISVSLDTYHSHLRRTPMCNLRACVGHACAVRHACVLWHVWMLRMGSMLRAVIGLEATSELFLELPLIQSIKMTSVIEMNNYIQINVQVYKYTKIKMTYFL